MEFRVFSYFGTSGHIQLCGYYLRLVLVAAKGTGRKSRDFSSSHPVLGVLWALLFRREQPQPNAILGGLLILGAVVYQEYRNYQR